MRLQAGKQSTALAHPVAEDLGDCQSGVVVRNRERHAAEEAECRKVVVAERFGRLGVLCLNEDRVASRKVHHEEPDLLLGTAQNHHGLTEIGLRVASRMQSWNKHFAAG